MTATAPYVGTRIAAPFKGLECFREDDAPFFFGRERESGIVIANLLASRLTLLYGQSGVGKSSLLRAGVLPRLAVQGDVVPVVFSSWIDPPVPRLAAALTDAVDLPPVEGATLVETLDHCARAFGGDLLLILDQFEEYFVYHREDEEFARQLAALVRHDDLPVSVLISIREDALARLDRFKGLIPGLFDNYLRVAHLDRESGRAAILGPLAEYAKRVPPEEAVGIEPELVDVILGQVETGRVTIGDAGAGAVVAEGSGRIETPYLQLVLTRLWREEAAAGSRTLRRETLRGLGGADEIVRTHLDDALAGLPPAQQQAAARIFRFLVTPSGTKIAYRPADLAEYAEVPPAAVADVLDVLASQEARVVRPVEGGAYEIYHDVLAAAVLDWRTRYLGRVAAVRRRRARRIAAGVLLAAAAAGAGVFFALYRGQVNETVEAQNKARIAQAEALPGAAGVITPDRGPLAGAAFAEAGRRIVTAAASGSLDVWQRNAATGNYASGPLSSVRVQGKGKLAVTAGPVGATVWTVATGAQSVIRTGPSADAVLSSDERTVAVAGRDGVVRAFDVQTHGVLGRATVDGRSPVLTVDFTHDGRSVVFGTADGRVLRAPVQGETTPAVLVRDAGGQVNAVRVSPNGGSILYAGAGGAYLKPNAGDVVRLTEGTAPVTAAAFSGDGRYVVTAAGDITRVWDWRGRAVVARYKQPEVVTSAVFSPGGGLVLTASHDGTARTWNVVRPDLTVGIRTSLRSEGPALVVDIEVANVGGGTSPATQVTLTFAGSMRRSHIVEPLRAGERPMSWRVQFPVQPGTPAGANVVASVNPGKIVTESDYANDVATAGSVFALPDLVVTTLGVRPVAGGIAVLTRVANRGLAVSSPVPLVASAPGYASKPKLVPALAPGASARFELTLTGHPAGTGRITVTADPKHVRPDKNYVSNTDYAPIP